MPVWPDCAQGRHPAPASPLLMALEAAHTPTSCHVAKHTHAGLRSVGARTQTSPWRASPPTTCARPYPSLKWRARRQPLILVSRTQTHSNASWLEMKCSSSHHTLSFTHNALWPALSDFCFCLLIFPLASLHIKSLSNSTKLSLLLSVLVLLKYLSIKLQHYYKKENVIISFVLFI